MQRRLPPGKGRVERCAAAGQGRAHERVDRARGGPGHDVQPLADDDAVPPVLDRAVSRARRVRDRGEPAVRIQPRAAEGAPARRLAGPWHRPGRRARVGRRGVGADARGEPRVPVRRRVDARRRLPGPARRHPRPGRGRARLWCPDLATGTRATGIELGPGREVRGVVTENGPVECEVVVNAAGMWAPRVAAMAGAFIPSTPVDHQHVALRAVPATSCRATCRVSAIPTTWCTASRSTAGSCSAATRATPTLAGSTVFRGSTARARCRPTRTGSNHSCAGPSGGSPSWRGPRSSRSCATRTR